MSTHLQKSDPGRLAFRFSTLGATLVAAQDFAVEVDVQFGRLEHARFRAGEGGTLVVPAGSWVPGARFVVLAERTLGGATVLVAAPDAERDLHPGLVIGGFAVGADNHPDPASAWDIAPRPRPATPRTPTATAPEGGAPAMLASTTTHHNAPPPPGCADLSTPALMAIVMRRVGDPTTRLDFLRAPETGHLTEEQLNLNLAKAELILIAETERLVFPLRPVHPWDDPAYRAERIARGARLVGAALAAAHYSPAEIKAIGPAIAAAALAPAAPVQGAGAC